MQRIQVEGVHRSCSNLVMGSMIFAPSRMELVCDLLDTYLELGGNTIDTAQVYGGGESEKAIGEYVSLRKNRDRLIILTKGAHPDHTGPRVNPEAIREDLFASLERLQTEYIDIYMLHRDDPNVPIGIIMETMNEHLEAGRFRAIGVSNWSTERIAEANAFAASHGLKPIVVNSPNLSLAKPNEPRWAGCVSADQAYCRWHEDSQMPLFSWSSQAGGFFTGRFAPDVRDDAEMVRVYYNEDNWERLRRARELAEKKDTTAIQVALAWVLHQPFPTCALIGPQTKAELLSSWEGLSVTLTPQEVRWLDLLE